MDGDDELSDLYASKVSRQARFEVYKDSKGRFRFRLKAPNNEIIAVSESYTSKTACMNGIDSIIKNAPYAEIKDLTE